jgi:DNA-binding NarL/FixJ family response regulator
MIRVVVVSNRSLFGRGIEHLLREQPDLDVHGWEGDRDGALRLIDQLAPDVVIFDCGDLECDSALELVGSLGDRSKIKTILVSLDETCACIYRGERRGTADLDSILDIIRED